MQQLMKQSHPSLVDNCRRPKVEMTSCNITNKQAEYWRQPPLPFHLAKNIAFQKCTNKLWSNNNSQSCVQCYTGSLHFNPIIRRLAKALLWKILWLLYSIIGYCTSIKRTENVKWSSENMSALGAACACRRTGVMKQD